MSPLFGNKQEKAEQQAVASAEVERLVALPASELAAELMPAFGPDGARHRKRDGTPPMQIVQWFVASYPYYPSLKPLVAAVLAGLQALENAGLVLRRSSDSGGMRFQLTPLGETALVEGSAKQYLAPVSSN